MIYYYHQSTLNNFQLLPRVGATATTTTSRRRGWLVIDRGIAQRSIGVAARVAGASRVDVLGSDTLACKCGQPRLMHCIA